MIVLEKVNKAYGKLQVVKDISFKVKKGETLVLLGKSGCGKTTILKMINRLIHFSSGSIYIDGLSIMNHDPVQLRRNIGYVFQNIGLFPHMTIYDNLIIVPKLLAWEESVIQKQLTTIQETLQIDSALLKRKPRQLSGGQLQRVGVGRALMANPEIVLMDEPFGALDPITREEVQDEFLSVKQMIHKTIVFVTHDIHEAFSFADRICLLEDGFIAQLDTPYNIIRSPANEFVERFVARHRKSLLSELDKE